MPLPAPNLDDRRFQDLVDEAKRLIAAKCPEWTDHNVSDPGVTLIELFASMTEQLVYRLNRVPDRNFVKFLDLLGVRLFPPTAARADLTFWLTAPRDEDMVIPRHTVVGTLRQPDAEEVTFTTVEELRLVASEATNLAVEHTEGDVQDRSVTLEGGSAFYCFQEVPAPGDTLLIGLNHAVPGNVVAIDVSCEIEGVGVDPTNPPVRWEAHTEDGWAPCEVSEDTSGGFNRPGRVLVHVPPAHAVSVIETVRAGWLRCRVIEADEGQPEYSSSPRIHALSAATVGGRVTAVNASIATDEIVGLSEGVPGQRFALQNRPVVPGEPVVVEVAAGDGWSEWEEVEHFAESTPDDRHFALDHSAGEIQFGPAVREPDGGLRQYGAVPPKAAPIRVRSYRYGGGREGNVGAGSIRQLQTSLPFVARVENREPAAGGVAGESLDAAKDRGPILLRTRDRAVTAEDYEHLTKQAAPEIARVHCVPAADGSDPGAVRVLLVPAVADEDGQMDFYQLLPEPSTMERVREYLDERRVLGARIVVEPAAYAGVTVVARVRARPRVDPRRLEREALAALYSYFHPIVGGPDGVGWPFGRAVQAGEVYAVLQRLRGTEVVEDARVYPADPITGERREQTQRLEIDPNALVFPFEHQVLVQEST